MTGRTLRVIAASGALVLLLSGPSANAALLDQVNQAFRQAFGRNPVPSEWQYWAGRVTQKQHTTYQALVSAMSLQKGTVNGTSTRVAGAIASTSTFKADKRLYPSTTNPNVLANGTLIKSPASPNVFYVKDGKKSWVIPSVIDKWLGENHYFEHDIIITISAEDIARYPQVASVNQIYIGKILKHPDGTQYFIDDKLRKRKISPSVRAALKIPGGNLYPTSAVHLREFPSGPAITSASTYAGGMVVYTGPYHGGRFWKIEENASGKLIKRLYLSDYIYEADGNPDESHRAPAIDAVLARHERGPNIERYPDGWTVGLDGKIFLVQGGSLRHITSQQLFATLGYKQKYILTVFPEFLRRYPRGYALSAFKSLTGGSTIIRAPTPAPSTAHNLIKVRPHIRAIIADMNNIYYSVFDKDVTSSENKFWIDYIYNGEVATKAQLLAAMKKAKSTGQKPALTARTAVISEETLEAKWLPYLFYFVHQQEPDEDEQAYWKSRIRPGDRDTIEKLGGTIQWLKDTTGKTRK